MLEQITLVISNYNSNFLISEYQHNQCHIG
jgi:hypothetical protein